MISWTRGNQLKFRAPCKITMLIKPVDIRYSNASFQKRKKTSQRAPSVDLTKIRMNDASWSVLVLLISTLPYAIVSSPKTPTVRTPSGPVRGLILRTAWHSMKYSSFKGIPYAKPPLGELRFKVKFEMHVQGE